VISENLLKRFDLYGPRYTSYPTADRFSGAVGAAQFADALDAASGRATSVYVHVPFCRSLCYYCACNKIVTKSTTVADKYVESLLHEIDLVADIAGRLPIVQLAFGGGTPNFLSLAQFSRLFDGLQRRFDLSDEREQSIEIDPRYLSDGYLLSLRALGFNRVSFGVQDFDEAVQSLIHRFQSFEQTRKAVIDARTAGIESVSFDLVYGLPIQSRETFAKTLERVLSLDPDRLALFNYAHIPERFKAQRRIPTDSLPSIDERVSLFLYARERLIDAGYVAIGLDHFAKPNDSLAKAAADGSLRRNFQGYSTHGRTQLIGLGVSAISQFDGAYAQNTAQLDAYETRIFQGTFATQRGVALDHDDRIRSRTIECIMCEGAVRWRDLSEEFSLDAKSYFSREISELRALAKDEIVSINDDGIRLTEPGRLLSRAVAMVFDAHRGRPAVAPVNGEAQPVRFSRIA
jgi:oxygen-independent coproporphyrinogen III oxidase